MIPKECLLCPQIIRPNFVVCKKHMGEYREYGQSPWFKELVSMQNKQSKINNMESYSLDLIYTIKEVYSKPSKRRFKPQKIPNDLVVQMRDSGMLPKEIATKLNANILSIYSILKRKRSKAKRKTLDS